MALRVVHLELLLAQKCLALLVERVVPRLIQLLLQVQALQRVVLYLYLLLQLLKLYLVVSDQSVLRHLSLKSLLFFSKQQVHLLLPELNVFFESVFFEWVVRDFNLLIHLRILSI